MSTPGTRCRQSVAQVDPGLVVIGDSHGEHLFPGLLAEAMDVPLAYVYLEDWPSFVSEDSRAVPRVVADLDSVETVLLSARWNRVNVESAQLRETIETLRDAGKEVVLLDDVPYFEFHAMECEFVRAIGPRPRCDAAASDYGELQDEYVPQLEALARHTGADYVPIGDVFCTADTCSMVKDGILQYADNGHVNVQGSRTLAQEILRALPIAY